jgi:sRNA-binding protein
MKTKRFDCVEMKRIGGEFVRQQVAGMTLDQEVEYWRQRSEEFQRERDRRRAQKLKEKSAAQPVQATPVEPAAAISANEWPQFVWVPIKLPTIAMGTIQAAQIGIRVVIQTAD